jgi:hypothetical protein
MKKYLKMSDFIVGDVYISMNHNGDVSVQYDYADPDMIVRKTMDAMEHAINSHDELVAMNKELLAALEHVWVSIVNDSFEVMNLDPINSAIAKAKAAS